MNIFITVCFLMICMFILLYSYHKSGKLLRHLLIGSLSGFLALVAVNYIAPLLGFYFSANFFTVSVSVILGIPGVISLILLRILF